MIEAISSALPQIKINSCLKIIKDRHTFIFEDGIAHFVTAKDSYHLHIQNATNKEFYFLQNDNCVMKGLDQRQCDYAIFNERVFHLVEVKVAESAGTRANHRKYAYKQLENTFRYYSENADFSKANKIVATICFPSKKRIVVTSASTKRKEFKLKYKIDLRESNYILID